MAEEEDELKLIEWVKSARAELKRFPDQVRYQVGSALLQVQKGLGHPSIKILKGFGGAAVREIKTEDESGTFRVVFTVQFAKAIYVLHAFQKKSKSGSKTPKEEMDRVARRLALAEIDYAAKYGR
ncbi:MAG TPA: type II toxin-antitoxin system RelE/ParE family toxin [Gemmataceae bacterium]|jgi:phage-related protein|nr:type II toxin-antitoxin system RelE/ParE family toxin [Gemmataceae bacterium]